MSSIRKILIAIAIALLVLFQGWQVYQKHYWRVGWNHYEMGGGVFLASPLDEEEMTAARDAFRTARKINPMRGKFWNYEGHAYRYLGDLEAALKRYESGKQALGDDFTSHYHIALCHMKLGNREEMIGALRAAVAIERDLNSQVRFFEDFAHLINADFMKEFQGQYRRSQLEEAREALVRP